MDIQLGTNTLRNTNGTFVAHGKEQLRIEWVEDQQKLVLTMGGLYADRNGSGHVKTKCLGNES